MFLIAKQNRYLRRFEQARAIDPASASMLATLGLRDSHVFRQLVRGGLFAVASPGHYHLVPDAAARFLKRRRQLALAVWGAAAVLALVLFLE